MSREQVLELQSYYKKRFKMGVFLWFAISIFFTYLSWLDWGIIIGCALGYIMFYLSYKEIMGKIDSVLEALNKEHEDAERWGHILSYPNREALKKRDEIIAEVESWDFENLDGFGFSITIPDSKLKSPEGNNEE